MKRVKITDGTYGFKPDGALFVKSIHMGEVVEVSDAEASRLIKLGVGACVGEVKEEKAFEPVATPIGGSRADEAGDNNNEDEHPAYSVDMKVDQLREVMTTMGVEIAAGMTKADMVAALDAHFASSSDDKEQPPEFEAESPIT